MGIGLRKVMWWIQDCVGYVSLGRLWVGLGLTSGWSSGVSSGLGLMVGVRSCFKLGRDGFRLEVENWLAWGGYLGLAFACFSVGLGVVRIGSGWV